MSDSKELYYGDVCAIGHTGIKYSVFQNIMIKFNKLECQNFYFFFCFRFAVNAVNGTLQWRRNCKPQLEAQLGCTEHEAFHGLFKVDECLCNTSECNENMGTIGTTSTSTITSSTTTSIKTSTSTSTAKTSSSTSTAKTSSTTSLTETTTGSTTTGE